MKCAFCKKDYQQGKGILFVKDSGAVLWFCSRKCRKSFEFGRKPWKLKWTKQKIQK
ncbi:MAG: 50S ribosomal protein L24 [Candidatus Pacearchaeota archaeon]|nr:50S ribosomal protein L24 [Candidatus Pacearchaeota archaeon]